MWTSLFISNPLLQIKTSTKNCKLLWTSSGFSKFLAGNECNMSLFYIILFRGSKPWCNLHHRPLSRESSHFAWPCLSSQILQAAIFAVNFPASKLLPFDLPSVRVWRFQNRPPSQLPIATRARFRWRSRPGPWPACDHCSPIRTCPTHTWCVLQAEVKLGRTISFARTTNLAQLWVFDHLWSSLIHIQISTGNPGFATVYTARPQVFVLSLSNFLVHLVPLICIHTFWCA